MLKYPAFHTIIFRTMRCGFLFLTLLPLTGCIFRTHDPKVRVSTADLKKATLEQLVETINNSAAHLQTLNANIDIDTSVGGPRKGKVTDYQEISGYLLIRKPAMLRMIGLAPVVRSTLFDMVSNGQSFELSIPPQKKFFVGTNQVGKPSDKPLENLRPQTILDALLLKPIDQNEIAVLEQSTETVKDPKIHKDVEQDDYVVIVLRKEKEDDRYILSRRIVFSRTDLLPHRQFIYGKNGELLTDVFYETFTDFGGGTLLPTSITIDRPKEEYEIVLNVTKSHLNEPLKDEQFVLSQPSGSQLINLDDQNRTTAAENQAAKAKPKQN
ncbi:MAG TPA: hypothetical protein VHA33_02890 [Candidatus Angelobacter sp.]|jgi:hypothetical protein|nr:hypothetical protein [Candidatus Angelobacter sp.]